MNRRQLLSSLPAIPAAVAFYAASPVASALDLSGMPGAATGDILKAALLTDQDVREYARQMAIFMDRKSSIAKTDSDYSKRLAVLTGGLTEEEGLRLNYKVYLTKEINAFAMADGTIRLYSGLMDMMTDDEIRYVIGHEMGHVKNGHTKDRMQTAFAASATQKAVASSGAKYANLADSEVGDLMVKVVRAQHSQSNEREADDYALQFMARRRHDRKAAVSALEKLAKLSGGGSNWPSTHPSAKERAWRMKAKIT